MHTTHVPPAVAFGARQPHTRLAILKARLRKEQELDSQIEFDFDEMLANAGRQSTIGMF